MLNNCCYLRGKLLYGLRSKLYSMRLKLDTKIRFRRIKRRYGETLEKLSLNRWKIINKRGRRKWLNIFMIGIKKAELSTTSVFLIIYLIGPFLRITCSLVRL